MKPLSYFLRTVPGERQEIVTYIKDRIPSVQLAKDGWGSAFINMMMSYHIQSMAGVDAVHLEDDIVLTQDFEEKVAEAVEGKRGQIVQLFSIKHKRDQALGSRWESSSTFSMNQCYCVPGVMAEALVAFHSGWQKRSSTGGGCDLVLREFMKAYRIRYFLHVPSLVQHLDLPILISPSPMRGRCSRTFERPDLVCSDAAAEKTIRSLYQELIGNNPALKGAE